ncbi:kinesin-related protein 4-like [Battus philenor]|uniref:kinesin-related protein 4-like n=1 Tax=Battus philenor TaxID=42288 RepID=UPI0035CFE377
MSDNIKVVVKVRPLISREIEEKLFHQWRVRDNTLYQIDQNGKECGNLFTFDKVYDEKTNTTDVYYDIAKPIVEAAAAGFNGTIFAYGQTSSGKTYTMTGTEESPGIIPLAVENLFDIIKNKSDRDFLIRVSYVEIYNDTLIDLLNIEKKNIKIHDTLQGVKVDATVRVTTSPEEVYQFMKEGQSNRQTGATNMNEESSRSHSIFQITIESREQNTEDEDVGCLNISQLNLVDLAGSERSGQTGATGIRFKEGTHINKSLSSLALVINQLSSEGLNKHVNYRDSKLTRILQNSLGGNAKTSIICAVTPAALEETISTLQFAYRAKAIKNSPEVNVVATDSKIIDSLTKQLSSLKTQLENKRNVEEDNQKLQKQISALQRFLSGFGQRSGVELITGVRRKNQQLRRATISTAELSQEDEIPSVPRFRTPCLKYNAMSLARSSEADLDSMQTIGGLAVVPEEPDKAITPPPGNHRVTFSDEIINLDSDDETPKHTYEQCCSPYHKCIGESKTPPCILKKIARDAEKDLKDIIELTKLEKLYSPNMVEMMEKLSKSTTVIAKLEKEIASLTKLSNETQSKMETLMEKLSKNEEEVRNLTSAKSQLESRCNEYVTKLTDWEVTCDTLKRKAKTREQELLSRLEEVATVRKVVSVDKLPETIQCPDEENNLGITKSDSILSNTSTNKDSLSQDIQELISDLREQLTLRDKTIMELEANLLTQNNKITSLENKTQEIENLIDSYKEQLSTSQEENSLHKITIETLNTVIENQKLNLDQATIDIQSYNDCIEELQGLLCKERKELKFDDTQIESLIVNEQKVIANNENIKNIVQSLQVVLNKKNHEIVTLKSTIQENETNRNNFTNTSEEDYKTQIATLGQQLKDNDLQIEKLLLEKASLLHTLDELNNKHSDCIKENLELDKYVKTCENKISDLKNINAELLNTLNVAKSLETDFREKNAEVSAKNVQLIATITDLTSKNNDLTAKNTELTTKNVDLLNQITDNVTKINGLQQDFKNRNDEADSVIKNYEENDTVYINKANEVILKLNYMLELTGNMDHSDINGSLIEIFENVNIKLDKLRLNTTEVVNQRDLIENQNIELCSKLLNTIKQFYAEIKSIYTDVYKLQIVLSNTKLKTTLSDSGKNETDDLKNYCFGTVNDFIEIEQEIQDLKIDKDLMSFFEKINTLTSNLKEMIKNVHNESIINIDTLTNIIEAKDLEINELTQALHVVKEQSDMTSKKLNDTIEENKILTKENDDIFSNIILIVTKIALELNLVHHLSCDYQNCDKQTYINDQILPVLNQILHYISSISSEQAKGEDSNQITKEKLNEYISQIKLNCSNTSIDLDGLHNGTDLCTTLKVSSNLLNNLKEELKMKTDEINSMKNKVLEWREKFNDFEISMRNQQRELIEENKKLKRKFIQNDNILEEVTGNSVFNADIDLTKKTMLLSENCNFNHPKSLLTITCNKIIEIIQSNEVNSPSASVSSSKCNIDQESCQSSVNFCECDSLKKKLNFMENQNFALTKQMEDLKETNKNLLKDVQEASEEIKTLLEFSYDLQKRIYNHKTNLSTLTAMTYAENVSLSSQIKFMQHHHTRFHIVCQRDLPELKKQLLELKDLLEDKNFDGNLNTHNNLKRYYLPNSLEQDLTLNNFKNESTLDGDVLMLDTNVTLASSADNTLTCHDQTCFESPQTCLVNDAICQTSLCCLNKSITTHQLCIDHLNQLEVLKVENENLNKIIKDLLNTSNETDSTAVKSYVNNSMSNICKNCQDLEEKHQKLYEELEKVNHKLSEAISQKEDVEQKYKNLCLEITSTEALLRKLHNFEKELENKGKDIMKLSTELKTTKEQLVNVQEENDNLSTQIMESISEADDLKQELDTLKKKNLQISDDSLQPVHNVNDNGDKLSEICQECVNKTELIKDLQSKYSNVHTHLNRSYSDSDTSSRYNKICTLQNELDAGREDCKELKEEVTTIKNHLESNNMSMEQAMALDESVSDPIVVNAKTNESMTKISEEDVSDIYTLDKTDCIAYYLEKVNDGNTNINHDVKIIDVMKLLYSKLMIKHGNEIENLINKLRDYEDTKQELQKKIINITEALDDSNVNIQNFERKFLVLKNNIDILNNATSVINKEENAKAMELFKNKILNVLDVEFSINSVSLFESIYKVNIDNFNETLDNYVKVQEYSCKLASDLETANSNLTQLKSQLSAKENECNLLIAQKAKIHEICDAVTRDLIKKEDDFSRAIIECYRKLTEEKILRADDFDTTLPPTKNLHLILERLVESNGKAISEKDYDNVKQQIIDEKCRAQEISTLYNNLQHKFESIEKLNKNLDEKLKDKDVKILEQKSLLENLNDVYKKKVDENNVTQSIAQSLTEQVGVLKEYICKKDESIHKLEEKLSKIHVDINNLKHVNEALCKEKEMLAIELGKSEDVIKQNKIDLEKMELQITSLHESVANKDKTIENLNIKVKSFLEENQKLKEQLDKNCKELSRLEFNIKTHETTAKIQTKMVSRLQKQKKEDNDLIAEKEKQLQEMVERYETLQKKSLEMTDCIATMKNEIDALNNLKHTLEDKISLLENEHESKHRPRLSNGTSEHSRRRRQSIHDSKRIFADKHQDPAFDGGSKVEDSSMDTNETSCRSTPIRHSKGRDSFHSKHEESADEGRTSRCDSARLRRQSLHDLHRTALQTTPEKNGSHNNSRDKSRHDHSNDDNTNSKVQELQERLSSCQQELEDLKEKYRELDEECEICAQYLQEKDEQYARLREEKIALEKITKELNEKLRRCSPHAGYSDARVDVAHAAVNTDEDWTNLHSVVVDRMSFDAEVEKNKRLTKMLEELRFSKEELRIRVDKMQRALEEKPTKDRRELEKTRIELRSCKKEIEELRKRNEELDEKCETCAQYLRERDEDCHKLKETIVALEAKLQELQENSCNLSQSLRKKRQTLLDVHRGSAVEHADACTDITEDFLNRQVERDNSRPVTGSAEKKQINELKIAVEKLAEQKAALEQQLMAATTAPVYVATGSAIVQNQQLTDVMKENRKLKKINAELVMLCKKREASIKSEKRELPEAT